MADGEAGRPTILDEELFKKIKQCILDGKDLRETARISEINEGTFYVWHSDNYLNIADKIEGWKRDRRLILADITSDTIQTLPVVDSEGKVDKELLKIKQKESEFIRETLGKNVYSKRTETDITTKGESIVTNNTALDLLASQLEKASKTKYETNTSGEGIHKE